MRYSPCQLVSWISSINSYVAIFHQTVFRQRPGREQINSSVAIRRFTHFQVRSVTWAEGLTIWKDLFMGILMAKKGGIHLRIPRFQASVLRRKRVDIFLYTYLYIWYIYIFMIAVLMKWSCWSPNCLSFFRPQFLVCWQGFVFHAQIWVSVIVWDFTIPNTKHHWKLK